MYTQFKTNKNKYNFFSARLSRDPISPENQGKKTAKTVKKKGEKCV